MLANMTNDIIRMTSTIILRKVLILCYQLRIETSSVIYKNRYVIVQVDKDVKYPYLIINALGPTDALLEILFNTGSCDGLLPDVTKPLLEPMLIYHQ